MAWVYQGGSTYTINYTTESSDHEKKFISLKTIITNDRPIFMTVVKTETDRQYFINVVG